MEESNYFKTLIKRASTGDQDAYSELIDKTEKRFFRFCLYLCGDENLAKDLCQDAYVKALEKPKNFNSLKKFQNWLFKVAKNQYLDFLKSPKNQGESLDPVVEPKSFDSVEKGPEFYLHIRAVLMKLDEIKRIPLILVDIEGYSYSEAAELIGVSESALRSRLHQARHEFYRVFKK